MSSVNESSDSHELAFVERIDQENSEASTKISEREPLKLLVTPANIVKAQDSSKRSHRKKLSKKKCLSVTTPLKDSYSKLPFLRRKRLFDPSTNTLEDQPQRKRKCISDDEVEHNQVTAQHSVTHIRTGNLSKPDYAKMIVDISSPNRKRTKCDSSSPRKMRRLCLTQSMNTECSTEKTERQMCSDSTKKITESCGKDPTESEIPVQNLQISGPPTSEPSPPITQHSSPSYKTHQLTFQPHKKKNSNLAVLSLGCENRPTLPRHKVKKRSPRKKQVSMQRQLLLSDLMKLSHHEGSTPQASQDISQPSTSTVTCTTDDSDESIRTHADIQSSQIGTGKKRRQRCRKCTSCSTPDCGECPECL